MLAYDTDEIHIDLLPLSLPLTNLFLTWLTPPNGRKSPHYQEFTITLRHTAIGRIPLDE